MMTSLRIGFVCAAALWAGGIFQDARAGLAGNAVLTDAANAQAATLPSGETPVRQEDFAVTRDATRATLERTKAENEAAALRIRISDTVKNPWEAQLKAVLGVDVRKGERGLFILRARAVETSHESSQAQFRLVVSDREKAFPRIATGQYSIDGEWREIALPFVFEKDYPAGRVDVLVDLGYGRQVVDVAELRLMRFAPTVELARLPKTRPTYAGREANAAWRVEALGRIERIRKGGLAVRVVDADGKPVTGARVRAELQSHAFEFGTVVNVDVLSKENADTEVYRRKVVELFNAASFENALKWANWTGEGKPVDYRERTTKELAWLRTQGFSVRGHVMVWPGWRFLPEAVKAKRDRPEDIREMVTAHIRDIALGTKGQISEWDVVNEPVSNHDLMDLLGKDVMVDWYRQAAELLPGVPLYLNDWGNHDQRANPGTVKAFEDVARYLLDRGAPLHGLGLQCHIGGVLNAPADLLATLDRYQKTLGLQVRITEFDVNVDDEEIQADYTRDFMIAMFSHPSVVGVQQWGFWAGRHWQPKAALFTKDWAERPNGAAYRKLVRETWHTDEVGTTDANGRWEARGFYGRYAVTVNAGEKTHSFVVRHEPCATTDTGRATGAAVITVRLTQ